MTSSEDYECLASTDIDERFKTRHMLLHMHYREGMRDPTDDEGQDKMPSAYSTNCSWGLSSTDPHLNVKRLTTDEPWISTFGPSEKRIITTYLRHLP